MATPTTYGSRDRNPFQVPKEYEINGVKTPSNNGDKKYYTLVNSVTGEITIKSPKLAGAIAGSGSDDTIGTIPKDGVFKPTLGVANVNETKYFSSVVGQKSVKNHGVITAQKAGAQNAQQLIFPNSATPGAGQGQNAPIPGVAGTEEFAQSIAVSSKTRNNFPQNLVYPTDLAQKQQDVIKFSMLEFEPRKLNVSNVSNLGGFSDRRLIGKDRKAIGVVVLPIPNGISDTNACNWGDGTMNPAEALLANLALTTIKSGFGAGAKVLQDTAGGMQENAGEIAQALAPAFAGLAAGQSGAQLLQRTEGAVFNPNLELLFNGPSLRPFNFTFKLASRSPAESETIRSIIRFFKQGMSPIRSQSNLFLKAPHTFQIQYLHRREEHKFLNKFKECALQSFNVSYTPEGQYATFNDGAMVSYQITMQFQELEPIFNDDYTNDGTNLSPNIGF